MIFGQSLFSLSEKIEKNQKKILEKTIEQIESEGLQISFTGLYRQSNRWGLEIPFPFVVSHTPEQVDKLSKGVLEGRVYDMGTYANITGTINPETVEFTKEYRQGKILSPLGEIAKMHLTQLLTKSENAQKAVKDLEEAVTRLQNREIELDERCPNRRAIRYQGQSSDNGRTYNGTWEFNSETADMATKGTFTMQRYNGGS